jgi:hypothetical protein
MTFQEESLKAFDEYIHGSNGRLDKWITAEFAWEAAIEWYRGKYGCCAPGQYHICENVKRDNEVPSKYPFWKQNQEAAQGRHHD